MKVTGGTWPWWCCGPAVTKAARIQRKRAKKEWKTFERLAEQGVDDHDRDA